jgi:hypothetical protein
MAKEKVGLGLKMGSKKKIPWRKDVAQGKDVSPKMDSAWRKNEPKVEDGH